MGTRPVGTLAVLLLVVTAGCNGLAGTETDTPTTRDPYGVPETTSAATTERAPSLLPGVTERGVRDPRTLARAHGREVRASSFVLTSNRTIRYSNGTLYSMLSLRVAVDETRTYLATVSTDGPGAPVFLGAPPASAEFWSNGTLYARAYGVGNETTYNTFEPPNAFVATWRYWVSTVPYGGQDGTATDYLAALFSSVRTRVADRRTENGTTVYRLVGTGPASEQFVDDVRNPRSVNLSATVDERGIVRRLELTYAGDVDGTTVRVTRRLRYGRIGNTTVDRPSWVDLATNRSYQ